MHYIGILRLHLQYINIKKTYISSLFTEDAETL